jgi:hypothetical protein
MATARDEFDRIEVEFVEANPGGTADSGKLVRLRGASALGRGCVETHSPRAPAGSPNRCRAEIRDGLEVRREAPDEPHQLHVSLALALQSTARSDSVRRARRRSW